MDINEYLEQNTITVKDVEDDLDVLIFIAHIASVRDNDNGFVTFTLNNSKSVTTKGSVKEFYKFFLKPGFDYWSA